MLLDLHVHTRFSPDSLSSPDRLLETAKRAGLNGIALTDHDTIRGGLEARDRNRDADFRVIVGAEIKTDEGDVIGLFLEQEVSSRRVLEVIQEIREKGGLSLLPHPCRGRPPRIEVVEAVDLIEVFNARTPPDRNRLAQELAARAEKPVSCGSDAHFVSELGACALLVNMEDGDLRAGLLRGAKPRITGSTPAYKVSASQIIKAFRSGKYGRIPYHGARMLKRLVWRA